VDYPAWLQIVLQAGSSIIFAAPIAIIVWMFLRWRRDRQAAIRPGAMRLLGWFVITFGGFFLLAFASGGHKASPPVELAAIVFILVLAGICVRWLWTLYVKIGVPRR
jgi:hypothetical protein